MKILTLESFQNSLDYSLKKDLLIPCWIYKIPIETSREKELNFLEETIKEFIDIDSSLSSDIGRLSSMLGFYDNKELIDMALRRLKDLRVSDEKNEVTVYVFYQDAYTGELLPIVTEKINEFSFPEDNYKFKENIYREISFKQNISSRRKLKAILVDRFKKDLRLPTKEEIIKTIYLHNQKNYNGFKKIDYKNFNLDLVDTQELIYLHVKLFIPKSDPSSIVISNGFTNDYSTLLRKIYEEQHNQLISYFREELRQETEVSNHKIEVPFSDDIRNFPEVYRNIKSIEESLAEIEDIDSAKRAKEKILTSLYDSVEKSFESFTRELKDTESLKNKKRLHALSKQFGFKVDRDRLPSVFNVSNSKNLQKFLAKALFYKKDELYEVALKYPKIFSLLSKILSIRNGLKHSEKEAVLKDISDEDIDYYKKVIYEVISLILRVKQKDLENNDIENDDDIYFQNSFLDLEKELSMDTIRSLPQEIKDNLLSINYYLNKLDFEQNKYNIVKETITLLSSSFEYIFKNIVTTFYLNQKDLKSKDEILGYIRDVQSIELEESLYTVSPVNIKNAQTDQNASLGAYFLVYLSYQKMIDSKLVVLIQNILSKRRHANPSIEEIEKIKKEELLKLKDSSFHYIKKLIEDRNNG